MSLYVCNPCRDAGGDFRVPADEIGAAIMTEHIRVGKHGPWYSDPKYRPEGPLYLNVRFKKLSTTAITPTYAHENDAGMDLYANQDFMIHIRQNAHIPTGIAIEIPLGYFGLLRPRSGLARDYSILSGGSGVIDSDYRGEVMVNLINHGNQPYEIQKGNRIAQLLILPVYHTILEEVNELSTTTRGVHGHGSTGK